MKALIHNDRVIQLDETGFPVHESLKWMDAPVGCETGWLLVNGNLEAPPVHIPTKQEVVDQVEAALNAHLSSTARQKKYDNQYSISTYVTSTNSTWKAEADAFVAWRDDVWTYAIAQLELFENDEREVVSEQDFINELPAMVWPA